MRTPEELAQNNAIYGANAERGMANRGDGQMRYRDVDPEGKAWANSMSAQMGREDQYKQRLMDQQLSNVLNQQSVAEVRQRQGMAQAMAQSGGNPWALKQAGMGVLNQATGMRADESVGKLDFLGGHNRARYGRHLTREDIVNSSMSGQSALDQSWNAFNQAQDQQRQQQQQQRLNQGMQQAGAFAAMAGRAF